jgi:hypothetical protein
MKKIKILFPVSLLCLAFGVSFTSASEVGLIATIQGSPMIFLSVISNDNSGSYSDGKEVSIKKLSSNGTITDEKENGTITINDEKNDNSSISLVSTSTVSTSTANFEINGDEERSKDSGGVLMNESNEVRSRDDLRLFAKSLINKNKDISTITAGEDRVLITRNIATKFFGFIPSYINETTSVIVRGNGNQEVSISRPWWSIFSEDGIMTKVISKDVETRVKNIPETLLITTLDATTKARILAEIQAAFVANSSSLSTVIK